MVSCQPSSLKEGSAATSEAAQTDESPPCEDFTFVECGVESSEDNEEDAGTISVTNGRFFSYFMLVVCFFSWLSGLVHLISYLQGNRWGRNPADYLLGNKEVPVESRANETLIDAHAIGGLVIVFVLTFQIVFTFFFQSKDTATRARFRRMHRIVGRVVVVLWCTVSVTGMIYSMTSDRWNFDLINRVYLVAMFWLLGIGSLINMTFGVSAICWKPKDQRSDKDFLLHKGCMSFSMYWILFSAFNENLTSLVQVIFGNCSIGTLGILTCQLVGLLFQSGVLLMALAKFDPPLLSQPFVRWNLCFQMFYGVLLLLGSIVSGMYPSEGTCLNPY